MPVHVCCDSYDKNFTITYERVAMRAMKRQRRSQNTKMDNGNWPADGGDGSEPEQDAIMDLGEAMVVRPPMNQAKRTSLSPPTKPANNKRTKNTPPTEPAKKNKSTTPTPSNGYNGYTQHDFYPL